MKILLPILITLLATATSLQAQFDGTADSTFADNGVMLYDFNDSEKDNRVVKVCFAPDGSYYIGGYITGNNWDIYLARFHADGTPDESFGNNGSLGFDPSIGGNDQLSDMFLTDDGKIVLVGSTYAGNSNQLVARFNPDGSLDPTFNQTGYHISGGNYWDIWTKGFLDSSGRIIAAGVSSSLEGSNLAVARFNTDGTFDDSFGYNGLSTLDFDEQEVVFNIHQASLHRYYLIAGIGDHMNIVAMDDEGELIYDFANNGKKKLDLFPDKFEMYEDITTSVTGDILLAGWTEDENDERDVLVVKLDNTGEFDTGFGTNGYYNADLASEQNDQAMQIYLQESGNLLLSGATNKWGVENLMTFRLASDGLFFFNYGENGMQQYISPDNAHETGGKMAQDPNGNIYVYGTSEQAQSEDAMIVKLKTNTTTSVKDQAETTLSKLTLAPNPTAGQLYVSFTLPKQTQVQVSLFDGMGRQIGQLPFQNLTSGYQEIDASSLLPMANPGMYLLKVQAGSSIYTNNLFVR